MDLTRRAVLAVSSAMGLTALAGCSSESDADDGPPTESTSNETEDAAVTKRIVLGDVENDEITNIDADWYIEDGKLVLEVPQSGEHEMRDVDLTGLSSVGAEEENLKDPVTGDNATTTYREQEGIQPETYTSRAPPTPNSDSGLVSRDYQSADGPQLITSSNVNHLVEPGTTEYTFTNTSYESVLHESIYYPFVGNADAGPAYLAFGGIISNDTDGESVFVELDRDPGSQGLGTLEIEITANSGTDFMTPFIPLTLEDYDDGEWNENDLGWVRAQVRVSGGTGHLHRLSGIQVWGY
ncbi:hypothetical protein HALLA_12075 [Halostagnicola larsenii XH-48]|uniref:Uncharacterized protein n=1 Tax=Halostagnicola larsenii XH-48 TaxID=797299 RepID=W0JUG2_9EURY|nr:hypothetical protein [Halostagnicola larsenii]AHG00962.1 hypothetical protein HALLA_12075 [Halostagnicola larsenii XH-48]